VDASTSASCPTSRAGSTEYETDHGPVDYAAIARGAGIEAIRIERPEDVTEGLKQALAHD
jgi:pyruvate dehydrogenase (quinone)